MNKKICIFAKEYYSDLKKKKRKILPFAATWIELKGTVLSEAKQILVFNSKGSQQHFITFFMKN